jgi:hypothetical protein
MYVINLEYVKEAFRSYLKVEPKVWVCPCGDVKCQSFVVYARGQDGKIYFLCTQSSVSGHHDVFHIDNVEDLHLLLTSDLLSNIDRAVYGMYFRAGLKEALLSA